MQLNSETSNNLILKFLKSNYPPIKINKLIKKTVRGPEQTFFQRRHIDGQ